MENQSLNLEPGQAKLIEVIQLFELDLQIPIFQRPYDWRESQIESFINDLEESADKPLFLGLIVLHKQANGKFDVIDGQQRLTSFLILLGALNAAPRKKIQVREDDQFFFEQLLQFSKNPDAKTLSQRLMLNAHKTFKEKSPQLTKLANKCTCIAYVSPQLAGATSLFERINMRGREVSQFDLVKNRLIGWINFKNDELRTELEKNITNGYNSIYQILNPKVTNENQNPIEFDVDRLLRVHWILFRSTAFKSSDKVIDSIEKEKKSLYSSEIQLAEYINKYVTTLHEVASIWVPLQEPSRLSSDVPSKTLSALYEFDRLNRPAEFEPLIVAHIRKFGWRSKDAAQFLSFCTLLSFRESLLKKQSNHGRSFKWTMAKDLYKNNLKDASDNKIQTTADISHQLFRNIKCWWNAEEIRTLNPEVENSGHHYAIDAFSAESFYPEFTPITHYIFWEYGKTLCSRKSEKIFGSQNVQINEFNDDTNWNKFKTKWDVEHIFPKNPDLKSAREEEFLVRLNKHQKEMRPLLNRLGNLTVVPQAENRGLLSNSHFETKRKAMNDRGEVRFNQLFNEKGYTGNMMNNPFWGPSNCRRRLSHIIQFATFRWGLGILKDFGVCEIDSRVHVYKDDEDDS